MHRKFGRLSVTLSALGIASGMAAQELSQKVQVQSSPLNLRMTGQAVITKTIGSRAEASMPGKFAMTAQQSQLVKKHIRLLPQSEGCCTKKNNLGAPAPFPPTKTTFRRAPASDRS